MRKGRWLGLLGLLLSVLSGCGTLPWKTSRPLPEDPEIRLAYARTRMETGKFADAARVLEDFVIRFPTHPAVEEAEALLVEALLKSGQLDEALAEAEFYLRNFPRGRYAERVEFLKIQAMWRKTPRVERDQEPTRRVLEEIDGFLTRCQTLCEDARRLRRKVAEKLAHRRYIEARVYRNLHQTEAERIYLQLLLEEFPETSWADSARARLKALSSSPPGS